MQRVTVSRAKAITVNDEFVVVKSSFIAYVLVTLIVGDEKISGFYVQLDLKFSLDDAANHESVRCLANGFVFQ